MAVEDDTARADDAPRKKRWWKRLPQSVDYPPRRLRLLVVPRDVKRFTIREAADRLARVAADEQANPMQRQTLRGKYRFIYAHALCELIRFGDFHLVEPRTVSRETFERFARWFGYRLTDDPNEKIAPHSSESALSEPVVRAPFFRTASDDELVDVEAFLTAYVASIPYVGDAAESGWWRMQVLEEMRPEVVEAASAGRLRLRDRLGHLRQLADKPRQFDPFVGVFARWADLEAFAKLYWDVRNEPGANERPPPPQRRQAAQEDRILEVIGEQGYDPLNLPERDKGSAGVKAEVWEVCSKETNLFTEHSFKHAWDRLRADKRIQGGK